MKIIDAVWEQRNMGVKTYEVIIDGNESLDEVCFYLSNLKADYIVVKTPVGRLNLYESLNKMGFSFVESFFVLEHGTENIVYHSQRIKEATESLTFQPINNIDRVCENISKGIFTTDRVSLDSCFTPEQAAGRFVGWMHDEYDRGALFFEYYHGDNVIGFVCMSKLEEGVFSDVLSGVYLGEKRFSPGSAILYKQLEVGREIGAKKIINCVSTNNPAVVHIYSQIGHTVKEIKYVFVKHNVR